MGSIVGIEHEFVVRLDGRIVDFRHVIHRLPIPGRRIDVADPDAYRGPWGGSITADGPEAEIATPPVLVGPGAAARLAAIAAAGADELRAAIPPGATLEGYSTHVSVDVPRGAEERIAREIAARWAPALTWFLDGPDSPGLLVRPRPGRVEIGGDFVEGDRLALAALFAVGAVRAAAAALTPRGRIWRATGVDHLTGHAEYRLPALGGDPSDAIARYGWFVGDAELGATLHELGAGAAIPRHGGGSVTVREHLRAAWRIARAHLRDVDRPTLARQDALIADAPVWPSVVLERPGPAEPVLDPSVRAWIAAARPHVRPGFVAAAAIMSWDFVVLRLQDTRRFLPDAWICLPRDVLGGALEALDEGRLDDLLAGFMAADHGTAADPMLLATPGQTSAAGIYRAVSAAADLVAPERGPAGGRGKRRQDSRDNRPDQSSGSGGSSPERAGQAAAGGVATAATGFALFGLPVTALAGIGAVALAAIIGGAVLLGGGKPGGSPGPSAAGASALDPCTLLTAADVTQVLGTPAGTGASAIVPASSRCTFDLPNGTGPSFSLPPDTVQRTSAVVLTVLAQPMTAAEVEAALPTGRDMTIVPVAGVGDGAWWADYGPTNQAWGRPLRVAYDNREFLVILYGPPTDPSTWQAAATELARRVIGAAPNGWPAKPGGSPGATATAGVGGAVSDPVCDPLLATSAMAVAVGAAPTSVVGSRIGSPAPQYGQGVSCRWRLADGRGFDLEQG